jgi:Flp pilus assembly protein TadG
MTSRPRRRDLRRARSEAGYAAVLTALLASTVFMGMAAFGVDTARWYVEAERIQKAADAAALAGVTYMPNDPPSAFTTAIASAATNGYPISSNVSVVAVQGDKPSRLVVTIKSKIPNSFGGFLGVRNSTIVRSAVADYTAPAPMGSPCNTFGNEPPSQPAPAAQPAGSALPTTPFPNCTSVPDFWAAIEGPSTDKVQGDRFMNQTCSGASNAGTTYECSSGQNTEYRPEGYFWAIHVEPQAVGTPIAMQLYDPAYIRTQIDCSLLYSTGSLTSYMNDYAQNDATSRYAKVSSVASARTYCSGDYIPGSNADAPPVTSFALRHANDTRNPRTATPIDISQCTKQFVGLDDAPTITQLTQWSDAGKTVKNNAYNLQMAQLLHQWVDLCTFTPDEAGDYYLQVRTNVSTAGGTPVANTNPSGTSSTPLIYTGNPNVTATPTAGNTVTTGVGLNSFALRTVPLDASKKPYVAMAGNESMPILQNADGSTAEFNLIRALPATRGQFVAFDFYDPADGAGAGGATVKIIAPVDATGTVQGPGGVPPDCKHAKNDNAYVPASNCTVTVKNSTHDGQVEHILIPIPNDYNCDPATLGGCWFSVRITFPGTVTDFTTWTANIGGDPVRLIE